MQFTGVYLLYRTLQTIGFPFIVLYFLARIVRNPHYIKDFGQRLGFLPRSYRQTGHISIWLHAVSVGEVLCSRELIRKLRTELPSSPVFVSSGTLAGKQAAEEALRGLVEGVFYAPLDYASVVRRVLAAIRPKVVVVLETEIWPNLFREAKRSGCGLVIVNGRISDKALPSYNRLRWFFQAPLAMPDSVLAQDDISLERFLHLGAPAERTRSAGNLKYDFNPQSQIIAPEVARFLDRVRPTQIWIAASTMPAAEPGDVDEDDAVIAAFLKLREANPGLLLILVPRKPERFNLAAQKLSEAGVPFVRRSCLDLESEVRLPGVLLLDSIGELGALFRLGDVVFMGGTLARRGGHNILEPALHSKPVITGPNMQNFASIQRKFEAGGGIVVIAYAEELSGAVSALLNDPERRTSIGAGALELARTEQGAVSRALEQIREVYWRSFPRVVRPLPIRWLLGLLSRVWAAGSAAERRWFGSRRVRLRTPVISVGGISAGGAGKSPLVLWLAEHLRAAGHRPAILTRGYRRRAREQVTVLQPGSKADVSLTGDEAQAYLRAAVGPIGISANRARAGRAVEEAFQPGVFVLDDGFQHWRLHRQMDIVVIDALDPFSGGVIPAGRLREGPQALRRADAIVITRVQPGQDTSAIKTEIRKYEAHAPVFLARTIPLRWVDARSGDEYAASGSSCGTAVAFCGLGNPESFWRSVAECGLKPVLRRAFRDHHRYTAGELAQLADDAARAGAECLLTTEKDLMNLPENWPELIGSLRLLYLRIGLEIDGSEEFLRLIEERIARGSEVSA